MDKVSKTRSKAKRSMVRRALCQLGLKRFHRPRPARRGRRTGKRVPKPSITTPSKGKTIAKKNRHSAVTSVQIRSPQTAEASPTHALNAVPLDVSQASEDFKTSPLTTATRSADSGGAWEFVERARNSSDESMGSLISDSVQSSERRRLRRQSLRGKMEKSDSIARFSFQSSISKLVSDKGTGLSHYGNASWAEKTFDLSQLPRINKGPRKGSLKPLFERIEVETDKLSPWDTPRLSDEN